MNHNVQETLQEADTLISAGRFQTAQKKLASLQFNELTRAQALTFAQLQRRSGQYEKALKALHPYVRSENSLISPTPQEVSSYAGLLNSIGGNEEAINILEEHKAYEKDLSALLTMAFAHFGQWKYGASLPFLKKYLSGCEKNSYAFSIGQVNYVAALVAIERFDEALDRLAPLIKRLKRQQQTILAGNCHEIMGQIYFKQQKWKKALNHLDQALPLLGGKQPDTLFVEKWKGLLKFRDPKNSLALSSFKKLATKANELKHWETLRDMDKQRALITSDPLLFNKVYYGTPFQSFKDQLLIKSGELYLPEFERQMGGLSSQDPQRLETESLRDLCQLRHSSLENSLLQELLQDFYRPQRSGSLFAQIYKNEYFHPDHSYRKIKILVSRLRKRLNPLGLDIENTLGKSYQLIALNNCTLIYSDGSTERDQDSRLTALKEHFQEKWFKTSEAVEVLSSSERTVSRWLKGWVEEEKAIKEGSRQLSRYRLFE